jgi:oligopeptide/dipeptide ABC transporter ATP-binding protein
MYAGKIIEMGSAQQIYHQPHHPYTLGLLASVPRMDQPRGTRLIPIDGQPPDLTRLDGGCAFRPRCRFAVERCAQEFPPLETIDSGHVSACWRVKEINELKNAS